MEKGLPIGGPPGGKQLKFILDSSIPVSSESFPSYHSVFQRNIRKNPTELWKLIV
jgi:hypothetical protein